MCGIVGITSSKEVTPRIISSLKKLEYRGYDSAGLATLSNGNINEVKCEGRVDALEKNIIQTKISGSIGIGHVDGQHMENLVQLMHILIHQKMYLSFIMV